MQVIRSAKVYPVVVIGSGASGGMAAWNLTRKGVEVCLLDAGTRFDRAKYWTANARALREKILSHAWDEKRSAITGAFGEPHLDASVLLVAELGLLPASDVRYVKTCETIGRELARNGWIMRYTAPDDFGLPETAFLACNFWYVDALSQIGRAEDARERFESILASRNSYGLLSEDIHPETGELWGNLPQTYSMAGIINTATRLSSSWEEAWARDLS